MNDHNDFHILKTIEADSSVSQKKISAQIELNVASVNFALNRLIRSGFIIKKGVNPRRTKYYITPEGLREKTHLAYKFLGQNMHYYKVVRNDMKSRIIKATNGTEISLAIYGVCVHSEIAYMVVSKMSWNFLGFFLEDSKITKEAIRNYNVQSLDLFNGDQKCLLLLTDECPADVLNDLDRKNIETLNLRDCFIY